MASMWTIQPFRSIILIPILNLSAMRTRNIRFLLALTGMEEDFQSDREREYFTIPPKKSFFDEKNAFILINCFRSFSFCAWKMCSCFLDFSFSLLLFRFFSGFGLWSLLLRCFMLIFFILCCSVCVDPTPPTNSHARRVLCLGIIFFTTQIHARAERRGTRESCGGNEK